MNILFFFFLFFSFSFFDSCMLFFLWEFSPFFHLKEEREVLHTIESNNNFRVTKTWRKQEVRQRMKLHASVIVYFEENLRSYCPPQGLHYSVPLMFPFDQIGFFHNQSLLHFLSRNPNPIFLPELHSIISLNAPIFLLNP